MRFDVIIMFRHQKSTFSQSCAAAFDTVGTTAKDVLQQEWIVSYVAYVATARVCFVNMQLGTPI